MLENWLRPVSIEVSTELKNAFGKKTFIYKNKFPDLQVVKVAIIGIEEETANAVRKELYPMAYSFRKLKIADLGNVRKKATSFLIPLMKELLDSDIIPIFIGEDAKTIQAQFQAHYAKQPATNIFVIDEKIRFDLEEDLAANYLNKILKSRKLFNLGLLGYQAHFTPTELLKYLDKRNFEHMSLGSVRKNLEEVEPFIRDADLLAFNLGALRAADVPAQVDANPSGFFSEEACQVSRYAGMSDKLSSIGFYGFNESLDQAHQTAKVVAQMIWYFIDGVNNRKNDFPVSTDGMVEYIVNFKSHDYAMTFWKSKKSGRWWMQVPVKTRKKHLRHRLVPCSYQDYQMACNNDLSDRLLRAYERFS